MYTTIELQVRRGWRLFWFINSPIFFFFLGSVEFKKNKIRKIYYLSFWASSWMYWWMLMILIVIFFQFHIENRYILVLTFKIAMYMHIHVHIQVNIHVCILHCLYHMLHIIMMVILILNNFYKNRKKYKLDDI